MELYQNQWLKSFPIVQSKTNIQKKLKEIASAFKTFNFLPQIWDSRKVTGKHENKSLLKTKDYNFCLLVLVLTSTAVYGLALSSLIPNGHSPPN